ncbi:MAG: PDZ domain-containing protein [Candidatus Omnitrophota bacterium]
MTKTPNKEDNISLKRRIIFMAAAVLCLSYTLVLHADNVVLKTKEKVKGVIVEDYADRVVLSTIEGEKEIMREDIKSIVYDLEEQNLTNLGHFYQDQGSYKKAYYYYDKALKINPDYKEAKGALSYVGTYLQQATRRVKLDQLERRNEEDRWRRRGGSVSEPSKEEKIETIFGFQLEDKDGRIEIYNVKNASSSDRAGLKDGDILLKAWDRAVSYMSLEDVMNKLLVPGIMDIKVTIEREYDLAIDEKGGNHNTLLGGVLGFSEMEGLMFEEVTPSGKAQKAGIEKGDIITSLDGKTTRYMPMEEAEKIITGKKGNILSVKIRRDIVIWKQFKAKQL